MQINIGVDGDWQASIDLLVRLLPIVIPIIILDLTLKITAIVSIIRKLNPWSEKILWLLLAMVNIIGPVVYFAIGSSYLEKLYAERQDVENE